MGFSVRLKRDSLSVKNKIRCPLKKYSVSVLTIIRTRLNLPDGLTMIFPPG